MLTTMEALLAEKDCIESDPFVLQMLVQYCILGVLSPLSLLKPHAREKFFRLFHSWKEYVSITIEHIESTNQKIAIRFSTQWNLVSEDLISSKSRAKIAELFASSGKSLRDLYYDQSTRTLHALCLIDGLFDHPEVFSIVQKIELAFTHMDIKNAKHHYPVYKSYEIIDQDKKDGTVYTIKITYTLPEWLLWMLIGVDKINEIQSYVRLPIYEHKIKSYEDCVEFYVQLHSRVRNTMKYTDFPAPEWLRIPMGFDLKYRRPIRMCFNQESVEEQDYWFAPHYIIAGSTASWKSNFIKWVITQLLRSYSPNEVRFFLVDPKVVTFQVFSQMPHLYAPVLWDAKKIVTVLQWIVEEVEKRYALFAKHRVENIIERKKLNNNLLLPHIFVIIDEFADIIDSQKNHVIKDSVIMLLKRLWQKARAAWVHVLLITQRATWANIDGEIKANMSGRIAFRVANSGDSQIILDDECASTIKQAWEWFARIGDADELIHFYAPYITDVEIHAELKKFDHIPLEYCDRSLADSLLREPLNPKEVTIDMVPPVHYPDIAIGIDLNSHKVITLHTARYDETDEDEPTPHIVVAGATNSWKSKFAKFLVSQLIQGNSVHDIQLILVDPKIVTFNIFAGIPYLYCPLITTHTELIPVFEKLLEEIKTRYALFASNHVENMQQYNSLWKEKLKAIFLIIDEFADIVDSYDYGTRDKVEWMLKRFGQMARAAWIHMILITQRATSQNIPGEIRTHFAGRMAFRMNTEADSIYIIEESWAHNLPSAGMFLLKKASQDIIHWYVPLITNSNIDKLLEKHIVTS